MGIQIIATDRRAEDFPAWRDALPAAMRDQISFFPLDVTQEEAVNELAATLKARGIHVALSDQQCGHSGRCETLGRWTTKTWHRVMNVNITGTFYMTRAFSEAMVNKGYGRIVNVASLYAYHPGSRGRGHMPPPRRRSPALPAPRRLIWPNMASR